MSKEEVKKNTKSEVKGTSKKTVKKSTVKNDSKSKVKVDSKQKTKTTSKKPVSKKKNELKGINKPIATEEITLEEADSFYHVSLLVQAVCVIGILFITILAIFEHSFTVPIEVLVGFTLLIMAYNNVKLFKRKGFTVIYIIFGILCLIVGILGYFGVTL